MIQNTDLYFKDLLRSAEVLKNVEMLRGKRILITGATGMLCSAAADLLMLLNKKYGLGLSLIFAGRSRERTAGRFPYAEEGKDFEFLSWDAAYDRELPAYADYYLHGASNAHPALFAARPVETMLANMGGMQAVLNAAVSSGGDVLYVSTSEVYGRKEEARPFREDDYGFVDLLNPRAAYPVSKRAAETLCAAYGAEHGIRSVIVRPGHIYGPTITDTDSRASAQFTQNALKGRNIVMKSAGSQLRSYCYIADAASAILAVLLKGASCEAYNISNPASIVTIREFAEVMAEESGVRVIFENPTDVEKRGYNLMDNSSLESGRLEALGWKACFSLKEGCAHTLAVMKTV